MEPVFLGCVSSSNLFLAVWSCPITSVQKVEYDLRPNGVFAPVPRDYDLKVNRKVRQLALKSAYSAKVMEDEMRILDKLEFAEIKTKAFIELLSNVKTAGTPSVILSESNDNIELSGRNIAGVEINTWDHVSVYDILKSHNVIITESAIQKIEEVLG